MQWDASICEHALHALQTTARDSEERAFLAAFAPYMAACYSDDCPIDLSRLWEWTGCATEDRARSVLLTAGLTSEYRIVYGDGHVDAAGNVADPRVMMCISGFQGLCCMSGTDKGRRMSRLLSRFQRAWKVAAQESIAALERARARV